MMFRVARFVSPALAVVALGAANSASAQLAAKSPFMPPQAAAAGPTAGAPLEYRGYIETSEGTQYRLYDPAKKVGIWVKLNEKNPDFDVLAKQHDGGQKTLTIEHQGKTLTLAEREAKVVSAGAVPAPMPVNLAAPVAAPAAANVAPAVTQSVVLNPTPADEQRRLDAVAAEVARRRALREQATQQMNQGVTPQVTLPQGVQSAPGMQTQRPPGNFQPQNDPNQRMRVPPQTQPGTTNRQRGY